MTRRADPEAGFTLIESLVAMAVLAVGAVSLLAATETHVARIGDVENRTVARWEAENRLAALRLGVASPDRSAVMGLDLGATVEREATADPMLDMVTIRVAPAGSDAILARLVGFVPAGTAR